MHLEEIAFHVAPGAHAVVILDQAGWHGSAELVVPFNITLMPLPPRCPELNPVENVWQFMRENWLSNRIYKSYDDSLGLLVIDQDMGDERRSVHSLSGGESFLVSLALALGLASLSSNRVKVESLFIDEGFGSLDADTLRIAMDALDSLQAQGRKVGVISHVQEMTERISTKLMVRKAAGGKSIVDVG